MKVILVSDVHYSVDKIGDHPSRRGPYALILLLRLVKRLNRFIKPDLVLFGGDMVNTPQSYKLLVEMKEIIEKLDCPYLIIRGNHDPAAADFASVFGPMKLSYTLDNIRFLCFDDVELPAYCAARRDDDLRRMEHCRDDGFDGCVITFQHNPLFPSGKVDCPYPYANAAAMIDAMRKVDINAALCGHYHKGFHYKENNIDFFTARSFIEAPFPFFEIELDDKYKFEVVSHQLAMEPELKLSDNHIHTHFAYCNENMDLSKVCELRNMLGLRRSVISEHSAHLLFNEDDYQRREYFAHGLDFSNICDRSAEYRQYYRQFSDDKCLYGMEIDIDHRGNALVTPEVFKSLEFANGTVHELSSLDNPEKAKDEFMFLCDRITDIGIDALAHPFRVFGRRGLQVPKELYKPLAELLAKKHVAVEMNFHTNDPDIEFFDLCLGLGVKVSLGSDSHNLYEVGEFFAHLQLLSRCRNYSPELIL